MSNYGMSVGIAFQLIDDNLDYTSNEEDFGKKIVIDPFVEVRPMSTIAATFDEIHKAGSPAKRVVLKPDF